MLHNVASCLKILNLLVVSAHQEKMKKQRAHSDKERSSHGLLYTPPFTPATLHSNSTTTTTTRKTRTLHYACGEKNNISVIGDTVISRSFWINHVQKIANFIVEQVIGN
jgi:hypothetical protein